jgi:Na+-translocating ferredoxin:NAD+ oxidoreductase RnfD subunit
MIFDPFVATGVLGTAVIVAAYFANQSGRLRSDDRRYPLANLVGSLMILASFYSAWNLPAALIEVLWAAVSLYGLLRPRAG